MPLLAATGRARSGSKKWEYESGGMGILARTVNMSSTTQTAHLEFSSASPESSEKPPKRKRGKGHRPRPSECLNCGKKPLTTDFCPDCGQENLNYAVPLGVLFEDVFDEFLKWDGRLLRTLTLLLSRPGRFTAEYTSGRRVRYVSPFKLYLGVTTVFFLVLFFPQTMQNFKQRIKDTGLTRTKVGKSAVTSEPGAVPQKQIPPEVLNEINHKVTDSLARSEKETDANKQDHEPSIRLGRIEDGDDVSNDSMFGMRNIFIPKSLRGDKKIQQGHYLQEYDAWQQDPRNKDKQTGLRHLAVQQSLKCIDDPQHFLQGMVEGTVKSMFFLMPVYALLLGLLFRTPRKFYVEHLVFAVNHHTFAFFLAGLLVVAVEQKATWMLWLLPGYYIYEFISLRVCYRQGKRLTLFKQFVLNQFYFFFLLVGLLITAMVTLAFL
jgi:hypothetical protein